MQEEVLSEFTNYSTPIFDSYVREVNRILSKFTNNVRLHSLINPVPAYEAEKFKPSLILEIQGKFLQFKLPDLSKKIGNAKFLLSEGDKNAIALSFFLARLEINGKKDRIILIDDPLSSFDYERKMSTVNLLSSISIECQQFFLLTHDIYFAKAIKDKLDFIKVLNLKIIRSENFSSISVHDIDFDTLTGYKKDIKTVKAFQDKSLKTETDKREVIRCIRPILETAIKAKYFDYLRDNDWLGDIIGKVRNCGHSEPLAELKKILPDIINLNDYTKGFHHSEREPTMINDRELDFNIELLKKTLLLI